MRQGFGSATQKPVQFVIGSMIVDGVLAATLFTLFVVPVAYDLPARGVTRGGLASCTKYKTPQDPQDLRSI